MTKFGPAGNSGVLAGYLPQLPRIPPGFGSEKRSWKGSNLPTVNRTASVLIKSHQLSLFAEICSAVRIQTWAKAVRSDGRALLLPGDEL